MRLPVAVLDGVYPALVAFPVVAYLVPAAFRAEVHRAPVAFPAASVLLLPDLVADLQIREAWRLILPLEPPNLVVEHWAPWPEHHQVLEQEDGLAGSRRLVPLEEARLAPEAVRVEQVSVRFLSVVPVGCRVVVHPVPAVDRGGQGQACRLLVAPEGFLLKTLWDRLEVDLLVPVGVRAALVPTHLLPVAPVVFYLPTLRGVGLQFPAAVRGVWVQPRLEKVVPGVSRAGVEMFLSRRFHLSAVQNGSDGIPLYPGGSPFRRKGNYLSLPGCSYSFLPSYGLQAIIKAAFAPGPVWPGM